MKLERTYQGKNQKPAGPARSAQLTDLKRSALKEAADMEEIARKAYFIYLNQGSPQGHEVEHWLAAEAECLADATRIGPPNLS